MSMKEAKGYSSVQVMKFVYVFDTGDYETAGPMTYYDMPYHSHLYERLADRGGDAVFESETVEAYLLLEEGDNALDNVELPANTVACLSDPIPAIIDEFRVNQQIPVYKWYNAKTKEMFDQFGNKYAFDDEGGAPFCEVCQENRSDHLTEDHCEECEELGHDAEDHCSECGSLDHDETEHCEYCGEVGHDIDECEDNPDNERYDVDYTTAMTMKFVYDPAHDEFVTGTKHQTYYDRPHHSDYMEELAEITNNWDMEDIQSGYLFLEDCPDNALDSDSVEAGTIVTTFPLNMEIVNAFRAQGQSVYYWHEAYSGTVSVPQPPRPAPRITRIERRVAVVPNFSLIKFVSLPDKFLVGENTHHAYLLNAEYGTKDFPAATGAIGRASLEDGVITGIGFDFGGYSAQSIAIAQLKLWAAEEGYEVSPELHEEIIGLSTNMC
jgi:hypothetical protein